jgi:AAA domain
VMPEERQIGRRPTIERLVTRIAQAHQWIVGPRRIGKTSVAKAVLARLRQHGVIALDVDLSKLEIVKAESLAAEIVRQAHEAGVEVANAREDGGSPGLDDVFVALVSHGRATGTSIVILIDEVHLLAGLPRGERELARWCREENCPLLFMFAGSEESAVRALREQGAPLALIGQEFELSDIAREDWMHGLARRFQEVDVRIDDRALSSILDASEGHPRRTMLIASNIHMAAIAQPDRVANQSLVELSMAIAHGTDRGDPSGT